MRGCASLAERRLIHRHWIDAGHLRKAHSHRVEARRHDFFDVPKPGVGEHLGIGVLLEDAIAEVARLALVTPLLTGEAILVVRRAAAVFVGHERVAEPERRAHDRPEDGLLDVAARHPESGYPRPAKAASVAVNASAAR